MKKLLKPAEAAAGEGPVAIARALKEERGVLITSGAVAYRLRRARWRQADRESVEERGAA